MTRLTVELPDYLPAQLTAYLETHPTASLTQKR